MWGVAMRQIIHARRARARSQRLRGGAVCFAATLVIAWLSPHMPNAAATTMPAGFSEYAVAAELDMPTALAFAPDGRLFVAEKRGVVKMFDSIDDTIPTVFADLRTQVLNAIQRGLLAIAV